MEIELHEFQASILRELLFKPNARFTDLKTVDVENDHFSYHVNHLVEKGLVIKDSGTYILSQKGKEFANRLDTESLQI
jgi:predicted transcriptional regulator